MIKWYKDMSAEQVASTMEECAGLALKQIKKGNMKLAETYYTLFQDRMKEVTPAIVDTKTEFYMHNKEIYNSWNECMERMHKAKSDMDSALMQK